MGRLSQRCRENEVPFIFDPGQSLNIWQGEELRDALTGATVFISNDYELAQTMKSAGLSFEELLKRVRAVVTTRGEEGSVVVTPEGERAVPPVRARKVSDPTGAGDAYRAGFIKGMVLGLDLYTCGLLAGACGAYAVENPGTQSHSFTFPEIAGKLKEEFGVTL
jgi:adenosine kinase